MTLSPTTELPPMDYPIPSSVEEMLGGGPSAAGFHAVSSYLTCPEAARLRGLGVHRKMGVIYERKLEAFEFGTLIHALLSIRIVHGAWAALELVRPHGVYTYRDLGMEDLMKAFHLLRTYDEEFPLESEPFEYLGVETPVATALTARDGRSCIRTVRYDKIVRFSGSDGGAGVFSLEHKTDSRGGDNAMRSYFPQFAVQVAIWNHNPDLVSKYGPMLGVIPDVLVKKTIPECERHGPRYISKFAQARAVEYMTMPEFIGFPVGPDGAFPRFLHNCWGRYRPCEYIGLCWENSIGEYEQVEVP